MKTNKIMKKLSKFDIWFKEQFGGLPNNDKRIKLNNKVRELRTQAYFLEQDELKLKYLSDSYRAALYAMEKYGKI